MKIVINRQFGGYGLSEMAVARYNELAHPFDIIKAGGCFEEYDISRCDPLLVQVVAELKELANGDFAMLKIVEIPDDIDWEIEEYDGMETIHEVHRSWS